MDSISSSDSKGGTLSNIKPRTIKRFSRRQRVLKTKKLGPYMLMQTLGEGEYGKVKFALHIESSQEVAVKLIRKESAEAEARRDNIEREIHALKTLQHPNIVKLYDVIETEKYFAVVIEYVPGGELFEYILAHQALREEDARRLFAQLISSVKYMHQKLIVHRDLKLENLLLDRNKNLMVTDFGFANRISKDGLMATSCGSPCYAAPELVLNASRGRYAGPVADVWSCGVILYAMLCGHLPYGDDPNNPEGRNVSRLYRYILSSAPQFPLHMSPDAMDLLRQMLKPDPSQRCTLDMVTRHPWLRSQTHILSKSEQELEQAAIALKPALRPMSVPKGKEPAHGQQLKTGSGRRAFANTLPYAATVPCRRGRIKNLFMPRTVSKEDNHAQALHTNISTLRSRFKDSLRKSLNKKPSTADGLADESADNGNIDEAVAFERGATLRFLTGKARARRYSTLGRATRHDTVPQPPPPPGSVLHAIETPLPLFPNKTNDQQCTADEKQQQQQQQACKATRKKVMKWFKRIVQSEAISPALNKEKSSNNITATNIIIQEDAAQVPSPSGSSNVKDNPYPLRVYHGPVDQSALTSCSPMETMSKVRQILIELGIDCEPDSASFRMECTRRAKKVNAQDPSGRFHNPGQLSPTSSIVAGSNDIYNDGTMPSVLSTSTIASVPAGSESSFTAAIEGSAIEVQEPIYGDPTMDTGDEVKFVLEICRLRNMPNLYIVHVRRSRGSARTFKFVYRKLIGFLRILGLTMDGHSDVASSQQLSYCH